jgi:hypothetical protein
MTMPTTSAIASNVLSDGVGDTDELPFQDLRRTSAEKSESGRFMREHGLAG